MQDVTPTASVKRVEIDSRVEAIQNILDRRSEIDNDKLMISTVVQLGLKALEWC